MILLDTQVYMVEMAAVNHQKEFNILKDQANDVFCEFRFLSIFTIIFMKLCTILSFLNYCCRTLCALCT